MFEVAGTSACNLVFSCGSKMLGVSFACAS
jgi:hypothetical protein